MLKFIKTYGLSILLIVFYSSISILVSFLTRFPSVLCMFISDIIVSVLAVFVSKKMLGLIPIDNKKTKNYTAQLYSMIMAFLFAYCALCVSGWISSLYFDPNMQARADGLRSDITSSGILFTVFVSVVIAPFAEELLYRHCIYNLMKSSSSPILAMLVSSFLFGASHLTIVHVFMGTAFGIFLTLVYELSNKNIMVSIMCHIIYNFMATFFPASLYPMGNSLVCILLSVLIVVFLTLFARYIQRKNKTRKVDIIENHRL